MTKENRSISILKGIACILVVLNHYHGDGIPGDVVYALSHFGVPIFFLVSGFFLYNGELTQKKLPSKIKHIFHLLLIHICLNVLDYVLERVLLCDSVVRRDLIVSGILSQFTVSAFLDSLLWSKSLFGIAQWFLIALLEAYVLFYFLYRCKAEIVVEKYGVLIAIVLFLFHVIVRIILLKYGITQILGMDVGASAFVRNVWFDAIPFMSIGLWLRKSGIPDRVMRISKWLPMVSVLALVISVIEYYVTTLFLGEVAVSSVLYFGTIVSVIAAFIWAVCNPGGVASGFGKAMGYIGKNLSMIVYFIFVIVASYLQFIVYDVIALDEEDPLVINLLFPTIVILCTIAIAWIIYKFRLIIEKKQSVNVVKALFIAICIVILFLPAGTEWRMIAKSTQNDELVDLSESLNQNYQSTIMITAQTDNGVTVDTIEMPIQQFIGGGLVRNVSDSEYNYSYSITYIESNIVSIVQSDNLNQVRIWVK